MGLLQKLLLLLIKQFLLLPCRGLTNFRYLTAVTLYSAVSSPIAVVSGNNIGTRDG